MLKNQLFHILSTLDRKEMTRFKEFSLSPYFNKHLGVSALVGYLSAIYPEFTEKNCAKEKLMTQIEHPSAKTKEQLAILFTYTNRLLDRYLSQESLKSEPPLQQIGLLRQLRQKEQYKTYEKKLQNFQRDLGKGPYRDGEYYYHQFLTAQEADLYYTQRTSHEQDNAIQQKENYLDVFYLSEKLKDACEIKVRQRIISADYVTDLLEVILKVIKEHPERYADKPPIVVYYSIYQMMANDEHSYYYEAFKAVEKHASFFSKAEMQSIYNFLQNYCVNQINKGAKEFPRASFELYQIQLERGLLIINDVLPEWYYKNIVTTALRINEVDWVYDFIETYRDRLNPEVKENAYSFNLASYYYATQVYDKALRLLLKVEYTDLRYSLSAKALLLRTYYDLEEHEPLISLCKSFRQFLQRHKEVSDFRRKGYGHFFDWTRKLSQLRFNVNYISKIKTQLEYEKLEKGMGETAPLFNRDWLVQRLKEIRF